MKTSTPWVKIGFLAVLGMWSATAPAGVDLTLRETKSGFFGGTSEMRLRTEGNYLRFETIGRDSYLVFNSQNGDMLIVTPERKEYTVVTKAMRKANKARMEAAIPKDPKQRAMVEAFSRQLTNVAKKQMADLSFRKAGGGKTVAGVSCEIYDAYEKSVRVGQNCIATGAADRSLHQLFTTLQTFMSENDPMASGMFASLTSDPAFKKLKGVPVLVTRTSGGKEVFRREVVTFNQNAIARSTFVPPSGYRDALAAALQNRGE